MSTVVITSRGEERIRNGHPWVYRSDVAEAQAEGGATVRLVSSRIAISDLSLYSA